MFMIRFTVFVRFLAERRCLRAFDAVSCHQFVNAVILIGVNEHSHKVRSVLQNILSASSDDDAGLVLFCQSFDDFRLETEKFLFRQAVRLRLCYQSAFRNSVLAEEFVFKLFVGEVEQGLADSAVLRISSLS